MSERIASSSIRDTIPVTSDVDLPRIGHFQQFVKWSLKNHDEFIAWWLGTPWAVQQAASIPSTDLLKHSKWDSKKNSTSWAPFDQGADVKSGKPGVICLRCHARLEHPHTKSTGPGTLDKHCQSKACLRHLPNTSSPYKGQKNIREAFDHIPVSRLSSISIEISRNILTS